jgi:hypothetical protein
VAGYRNGQASSTGGIDPRPTGALDQGDRQAQERFEESHEDELSTAENPLGRFLDEIGVSALQTCTIFFFEKMLFGCGR